MAKVSCPNAVRNLRLFDILRRQLLVKCWRLDQRQLASISPRTKVVHFWPDLPTYSPILLQDDLLWTLCAFAKFSIVSQNADFQLLLSTY